MKTLLFLIILVTASVSQAETRTLYCDGGSVAFTAEVPRSSDYYELKNAQITAAYEHTDFICAGNPLFKNMKCAGFWNGISSDLVEVSFTINYPQIQIYLKSLSTNKTKSWPCKFEYNE